MKNILLCALLLLSLSASCITAADTASLSLNDLVIPPPPKAYICDFAGIFGDSISIAEGLMQTDMRYFDEKDAHPYILSVPASYLPYIDTVRARVCRSWHICGDDQNILMIVTAEAYPTVFVYKGSANQYLNDTVAAFWAESDLPMSYDLKGRAGMAADFVEKWYMHINVDMNFENDLSYYHTYRDRYKAGPQNHVRKQHFNAANNHAGQVGLFCMICMAIILARVVMRFTVNTD